MGAVDGVVMGSGPGARAGVSVQCLVRCKGRRSLWFKVVPGCDVRVRAMLSFSVTARCG